MAHRMLEPCAAKVACTVLRGGVAAMQPPYPTIKFLGYTQIVMILQLLTMAANAAHPYLLGPPSFCTVAKRFNRLIPGVVFCFTKRL